jgi:hypothetical protein
MEKYFVVLSLAIIFLFCNSSHGESKWSKEKIEKLASSQGNPNISPEGGFLPTEEVASKFALVVLEPILLDHLKDEVPFRISRNGNTWIIDGKERSKCKKNEPNCFQLDGSSVHLEVDARDARVIKLYKYK